MLFCWDVFQKFYIPVLSSIGGTLSAFENKVLLLTLAGDDTGEGIFFERGNDHEHKNILRLLWKFR